MFVDFLTCGLGSYMVVNVDWGLWRRWIAHNLVRLWTDAPILLYLPCPPGFACARAKAKNAQTRELELGPKQQHVFMGPFSLPHMVPTSAFGCFGNPCTRSTNNMANLRARSRLPPACPPCRESKAGRMPIRPAGSWGLQGPLLPRRIMSFNMFCDLKKKKKKF